MRPLLQAVAIVAALVTAAAPPGVQAAPSQPAKPIPQEPAQPAPPEDLPEIGIDIDRHGSAGDKVAIGSDIAIGSDESVPGNVVCLGGNVVLDGAAGGDVVVIGGELTMRGRAGGSVVGVASRLRFEGSPSIGGDLVNVMGNIQGEPRVGRQVVNFGATNSKLPSLVGLPSLGYIGVLLFWGRVLKVILLFIAILLLAAIVPDRLKVIGEEAPRRPFVAFLAGLAAYITLSVTLVILCITIIGIPAALLVYFVFTVFKWLGLAGVFYFVGRGLGRLVGREFSLLGGALLAFVPFALLRFLPFCIGTFIWWVLSAVAVGLVVLTRAGGRPIGTAQAPFAAVRVPPSEPPPAPEPPPSSGGTSPDPWNP